MPVRSRRTSDVETGEPSSRPQEKRPPAHRESSTMRGTESVSSAGAANTTTIPSSTELSTSRPVGGPTRRQDRYSNSQSHEQFFPPPAYNSKTQQQQLSSSNNTSTMDQQAAHAYDQLDLNEDIIAAPEDNFALLEQFDEDPSRQDERPSPPSYDYPYQPPSTYERNPRRYPPSAQPSGSRPSTHYHGYPTHATPHRRSPPPGYNPTRSSPKPGGYYPYSPYYPHYSQEQSPPWEFSQKYNDDRMPPSHSKKPRREHASDVGSKTPEKSPYSPRIFMQGSSPMFRPSPALHFAGSFGVDTPSGALPLAEFSPLGRRFAFEETQTGVLHSMDGQPNSPSFPRPEQSPLYELSVPGGSPFDLIHRESPIRRHAGNTRPGDRRKPLDLLDKPPPKILWPAPETGNGGNGVRMEIGKIGSLSTNKLNLNQNDTVSRYPRGHLNHRGAPYSDFTPNKAGGYRQHHGYPSPTGGALQIQLSTSNTKIVKYPSGKQAGDYQDSGSKTPYQDRKVTPTSDKENNSRATKKLSNKRSPCNCKKSKCLKLYCECFAAERFCDGCNCTDCGNTPTAGLIRDKAMKETRAKNPNAFKDKIGNGRMEPGLSPESSHNMGCKCKKSECLKKYCECFQAGVICGAKCKCVDCQNYAGSQALIDKRRKIKDQAGADFAMRVADEAWKGKSAGTGPIRSKPVPTPSSSSKRTAPSPMTASKSGRLSRPPMLHSTPRGAPHPRAGAPPPPPPPPPPHYMGHPIIMGPPIGFSPMGPITPAGYPPHHRGEHRPPLGYYPIPPPQSNIASSRTKNAPLAPKVTPAPVPTPKTPAVRIKYEPKRASNEQSLSYFGANYPKQPKTTVLAIFSFLSNDDLYNAGLVCNSWSKLAVDGELWKFES